jgi:hypothetical protein
MPGRFIEPTFWALRMFDGTNYYPVPNPINRYILGSDYPDMNVEAVLSIATHTDYIAKEQEEVKADAVRRVIGRRVDFSAMVELCRRWHWHESFLQLERKEDHLWLIIPVVRAKYFLC